MTATDELRAMLDKLGIDWWDEPDISPTAAVTKFVVRGVSLRYIDYKCGEYCWFEYNEDEPMTPEQVIAVFGLHSCRMERECKPLVEDDVVRCSLCGHVMARLLDGEMTPFFCPWCGAEVVC